MGGPGSLVGLHFLKRPKGVGGAGRLVAPPIGLAPVGAADGVGVGVCESAGGASLVAVELPPLTTPMKPPVFCHVLDCRGLLLLSEAAMLAAAPTVKTVTVEAVVAMNGMEAIS